MNKRRKGAVPQSLKTTSKKAPFSFIYNYTITRHAYFPTLKHAIAAVLLRRS